MCPMDTYVMEDSLSVKSNESVATSEEFDFVGDKPGGQQDSHSGLQERRPK
ncbi:hypothetical protein NQ318_019939 [Aromia moschata]|uniref:Uncharacterized protein n=1 Tax=Aromia moschata TaxID=1265417 RepID=A0AAV8Y8E3_9CUCU|nr:hypothetical protein NQ318_019939 [Aromia moschata]